MSRIAGEGPCQTLGDHTFICEALYSPLWITSPAPGGLLVLTPITCVLHRYPSACSLGRHDHLAAAEGFVLLAFNVYVYHAHMHV